MYVSMVVSESLVAGTFGAYTLRLFPENLAGYASVLAVLLLVTAYIVNILGNKVIGATATITAIIKVAGIALLAVAGLIVSGFADITGNYIPKNTETLPHGFSFVAALALAILAYKGSLLLQIRVEISKTHTRTWGAPLCIPFLYAR